MKVATFTEFRRNASAYLKAVEEGERIKILRRGKPIAEIIPIMKEDAIPSWKKPGLQLRIEGVSLSEVILSERESMEK